MNTQNIMIAAILLILIAVLAVESHYRKEASVFENELVQHLSAGEYKEFDSLIQSTQAERYLKEFNRSFLLLSEAIMQDNQVKTDEVFDHLMKTKLNSKQTAAVCSRALPYLIIVKDNKRCRLCGDKINSLNGFDELKKSSARTIRIIVNHKTDYLDDLLKEEDALSGEAKALNKMLIAEIYINQANGSTNRKQ